MKPEANGNGLCHNLLQLLSEQMSELGQSRRFSLD